MKEREEESFAEDGMRPDEVVGADECDASAARCEVKIPDVDAHGVESSDHQASDEIHESFPIEPIPVVMGQDGLPQIVTGDFADALAVPFTYDTQLCIEDDRMFVEVFEEEFENIRSSAVGRKVWRKHPASDSGGAACWSVDRGQPIPVVVRSRWDKDGSERQRDLFEGHRIQEKWGTSFVLDEQGSYRPVRPVRERCRFYKRQVFSNDDQPDPTLPNHQLIFRVCTARRSNGGAYMSLRDEAVYVCDLRCPADEESSREQDRKDRLKLDTRPDRRLVPLFGQPGEEIRLDDFEDKKE